MKPRGFDPRRLHVEAFARDGASLDGRVALQDLPRLVGELRAGHDAAQAVEWAAKGAIRRLHSGLRRTTIALEARAEATLTCQRCLGPVDVALEVDRLFAFVAGEDEAARLDEDSEEDVLELSRSFDLVELLEDELILALPLVPRHRACPLPLPAQTAAADSAIEEGDERGNPFAALEALRRARPPDG
jgi:uncharacterized protein